MAMATVGQNRQAWTRGQQAWRQTWQVLRKHSFSGVASVWALLLAYPLLVQGVYYLLGGLWPLFHLPSFQVVTGAKTDPWLVRTVGVLVAVIGGALCLASSRKSRAPEILVVAMGSAVGLACIDISYTAGRRISSVYLLDAVVQLGIIAIWVNLWRTEYSQRRALVPATPAVPAAAPVRTPAVSDAG
jgi:hypothetical protein